LQQRDGVAGAQFGGSARRFALHQHAAAGDELLYPRPAHLRNVLGQEHIQALAGVGSSGGEGYGEGRHGTSRKQKGKRQKEKGQRQKEALDSSPWTLPCSIATPCWRRFPPPCRRQVFPFAVFPLPTC